MITVHRAIRPAERAQTFQARHAAYCLPTGGKVPLMTCRAQAPWKPHDEFDESPQTLLYYVCDGATVVGSSRLLGYHPRLGLQEQRFFIERAPGLNLSETMEPSRLSLIPAYRDKGKRRQALLALFSAMVGDSLDHRCTLLVATLRGDVVMLLTMMKTAVTLLGDQPVGSDPALKPTITCPESRSSPSPSTCSNPPHGCSPMPPPPTGSSTRPINRQPGIRRRSRTSSAPVPIPTSSQSPGICTNGEPDRHASHFSAPEGVRFPCKSAEGLAAAG